MGSQPEIYWEMGGTSYKWKSLIKGTGEKKGWQPLLYDNDD